MMTLSAARITPKVPKTIVIMSDSAASFGVVGVDVAVTIRVEVVLVTLSVLMDWIGCHSVVFAAKMAAELGMVRMVGVGERQCSVMIYEEMTDKSVAAIVNDYGPYIFQQFCHHEHAALPSQNAGMYFSVPQNNPSSDREISVLLFGGLTSAQRWLVIACSVPGRSLRRLHKLGGRKCG
jgi:hypothetical protein